MRLKELGAHLKKEFGADFAKGCDVKLVQKLSGTQAVFEVELPEPHVIRYVELREKIEDGQRIENFKLEFYDEKAKALQEYVVYNGNTVGNRKICAICRDLWDGLVSKKIRITVKSARDFPEFRSVSVF